MAGSAAKDRVVYPLQKWVVNPIVMLAHNLGIPPPGDALLESTGRRSGLPRRTPVCDGLDGERFWLVAQRGRQADWVKNIQANPRVRVSAPDCHGMILIERRVAHGRHDISCYLDRLWSFEELGP
jgi:deazaflavin-dependent oxidoreductase (nitroreductase family)